MYLMSVLIRLIQHFQIRDMLDSDWPWGKGSDAKPRGLRNLRLEELFPNKDYEKVRPRYQNLTQSNFAF